MTAKASTWVDLYWLRRWARATRRRCAACATISRADLLAKAMHVRGGGEPQGDAGRARVWLKSHLQQCRRICGSAAGSAGGGARWRTTTAQVRHDADWHILRTKEQVTTLEIARKNKHREVAMTCSKRFRCQGELETMPLRFLTLLGMYKCMLQQLLRRRSAQRSFRDGSGRSGGG